MKSECSVLSLMRMGLQPGSPAKVVMNPVQSPDYQDTESHSSLLVQDYLQPRPEH
ncbi:Uncharacterized protein dnm_047420 [Desulfonema magnum]|uniref:Uncharacterized protein n=1 Tax=Desulfonema magnum TaxID=45655 RepID=A0A975GPD8_9BACT|nr:Uncharacterized protein dnm_047420 [Desulfonema magnum]